MNAETEYDEAFCLGCQPVPLTAEELAALSELLVQEKETPGK